MDHTTSEIWDTVWKNYTEYDTVQQLSMEELTIRWHVIEQRVLAQFGTFKNLNVIEIGAGRGLVTLLMCLRGANGTILDYSQPALDVARSFYNAHQIKVNTILQDAFHPDPRLNEAFNVVMSFGLAEHFLDNQRREIIQAHYSLLQPNGVSFISVPNRYCFPYRLFKGVAELSGLWKLGLEVPFSRAELYDIANSIGFKDIEIYGSSFRHSCLKFLLADPLSFASRKILKRDIASRLKFRPEQSNPYVKRSILNDHFGYALTLLGVKR